MTTNSTFVPFYSTTTALGSTKEAGANDGPSSVPTVFVDLAPSSALTALPAPPLVPRLDETVARFFVPSRVPYFAPDESDDMNGGGEFDSYFGSVSNGRTSESLRATVRVGPPRSQKVVRIDCPNQPPTIPPPGSAPVRRAA